MTVTEFHDAAYDNNSQVIIGGTQDNGTLLQNAPGGITWRHIFDGKVWMTDAALRYSVQNVPSYVLIGKDGKVAGLRMFLRDENGVGDFRQLVENALK